MSKPRTLILAALAAGVLAPSAAAQQGPVDDYTEIAPEARTPLSAPSASAAGSLSPKKGNRGNVPRNRLETGFADLLYQAGAGQRAAVLDETVDLNAGVVRLGAVWRAIAPASRNAAFNPSNTADPQYNWGPLDTAIQDAASRGLEVILLVNGAPDWAEGANRPNSAAEGTWKPNPGDVEDFGRAIATRYSGSFAGLPRVEDFQFWAEPNLETNLTPIWKGKSGKKPAASGQYRKMLNAFYNGVHAVSPKGTNVVTGGTAPYGADPGVLNMRPMQFWRDVLCIKNNKKLSSKKKCGKAKFDVFSHHPINTSGGPTRSAINDDDVSTPDLHNLVDLLRAAEKRGNVRPGGKRPVWATEIWWESDPPDPFEANPGLNRQARWYEESLYSLWTQGASMVILLQVRDAPYDGNPGRFDLNFQTGVLFENGKPKPAATALSFPFVADRKNKKKVKLWGRAPSSGKLFVLQKKGKGTKTVKKLNVRAGKVFTANAKLRKKGGSYKLRAKLGGQRSLNYKVK